MAETDKLFLQQGKEIKENRKKNSLASSGKKWLAKQELFAFKIGLGMGIGYDKESLYLNTIQIDKTGPYVLPFQLYLQ